MRGVADQFFERLAVGQAGRLQHCRMGREALQLRVHVLDAGDLGLGLLGELVQVVLFFINKEFVHFHFTLKNTHPLLRGGHVREL